MPHIHIHTLNFQFYLYKKLIEKHWENLKKEKNAWARLRETRHI